MLEKIKKLLNPHKLVYLTEFGATLYGMNSPESDVDYKGIFIPYKEDLLLGKKMKSLNFSTGNDKSKNSKEDIDIDVWSLHYFLELLQKGETGAVDLLFSMNSNSVIFNELKTSIYDNIHKLFNPKNTNAFV
jgi:predicted nucleotidyltransferase